MSSTPNFQPIFEKALEKYKKKTGDDLTAHPLTDEIKACDSPQAVLTVLQGKANELNQSRSSDDRLTKWLNPTVNILNALSTTLGEGAGSVFPPTKIIFSGIGILLVAAKDTVASRDLLVELFDRIGSFFERLKVYTESPPTQAVTDVLVKTTAEVLSILAIATKGVKERRTKTLFKKLAGMNDIEDALQKLRNLEQGELLTVIAQVLNDTSGLKDVVKETRAVVEEVLIKMDVKDWTGVLPKLQQWLSPPDPSTNYNIGLSDLHKETATWFLDGRIFQGWHSTGSLLWIHGKPGSGKSILCSAIIQRILLLCDGGRASVAYFYFDFRDENKRHRRNLLPSLLVQLAAHSIPCYDIISRVYSSHGEGTQRPSDEVLINCLTDVLSATTQHPIYIIVDALDECPNTSGVQSPRERVLSLIKDLVDLRLRNLHICVTSRPEVDIRNRLEPLGPLLVSLHDQPGQKEDIAKYIRSSVDFISNDKRWREDDKGLVVEKLSEKTDGMFRWVFCQLEMLRLCIRSRVRHVVNELPDSLDETYERVLREVHKTNQAHVERLLQCLAVAIRPLRVEELAEILTSDSGAIDGKVPTFDGDSRLEDQEQELLSACPSLITIVGGRGRRVVQFSHFSVKEFLTSDRLGTSSEDISRYRILPEDAHMTFAQTSLHVLLRLDDRIGQQSARRIPLVGYAVKHWASHAQVGNVSTRVLGLMKTLFDSDKPHFATWIRIYEDGSQYLSPPRNNPEPLYYPALWGFYDLIEHLVKKHPEHVNTIGGEYDYPLVAALHGGHIRVAELLIQYGANVDIRGQKMPIHRAIEWPDNLAFGAVQFLLKHGADINSRLSNHTTPLHLVSGNLHLGFVRLLVEYGANVNARNKRSRAPLHEAIQSYDGNSEDRFSIVQLLIEHGADVDAQDENHTTPLHLVSGGLHLKFVRLLVGRGANVNAKNNRGRTPLHEAFRSYRGNSEDRFSFVQLLVERGADVDAQDKDHHTPLHLVCVKLHLESVRLLVKHGANVNAKNKWGRTPLHEAFRSYRGNSEDHFSVVQLLIEHGADVDTQDEDHVTPLHLVSGNHRLRFVRLLVEYGADVNAKNNRGQTPLHEAFKFYEGSSKDHFSVVQLLIEHGADVDAQYEDHTTPLHLVSSNPHLRFVRLLIEHGANVNAKNKRSQTPLHEALQSYRVNSESRFSVVRLLIEHGADVDAQYEDNITPLHLVSGDLHLGFVRLLVEHGANVNAKDRWGRTPLHEAFRSYRGNSFSVVQLLIEHGADVDAQDENHTTPLHLVFGDLRLRFMHLLIEHGANVNVRNKRGWTPLHEALQSYDGNSKDRFSVVKLLIEHGADVDAQDENHTTPLHLVSGDLHLGFVRLLVEYGANINAKNNRGRTSLHEALLSNRNSGDHFGVAQLLVERGADVGVQDEDHHTPLHLVCIKLHLEPVRLLIEHGANINAKNKWGRTPLHEACQSCRGNNEDHFSVVQLLIEHDADIDAQDEDHNTPLHLVSGGLHLRFVHLLIEHGVNVNAKNNWGWTPLHEAFQCYDGNSEDRFSVVQLLIEHGADVDAQYENHTTPLHLVSGDLHLGFVRLLVEYGANVNAKNNRDRTPLHEALQSCDGNSEDRFSVVRLLIEHGADVNAQNENHTTPLHLVSSNHHFRFVRLLVDRGANVNAKNKWGLTPLHEAFQSYDGNSFSVVQLLIECGADVDAQNENHTTPLHLVSSNLHLGFVRLLIEYGANVNAKNKWGRTPLHEAFRSYRGNSEDHFSVVQLLIEHGADVEAQYENHTTPLHLVSGDLHLGFVRLLVEYGANVNAKNNRGRTPLHEALLSNRNSGDRFGVAQLLAERGADANTRDGDHEAPLHLASRLMSLELAWILLKHGADRHAESKEGKIPFQLVQERMRKEMKELPPKYSMRRGWRAQGVVLMSLLYGY